MPAAEFTEWQAYFTIYPFSVDRLDRMLGRLCSIIYNTSGKIFKNTVNDEAFLFAYAKEKPFKQFVPKSLEQQKQDWKAFISRARQVDPKLVKERKAN